MSLVNKAFAALKQGGLSGLIVATSRYLVRKLNKLPVEQDQTRKKNLMTEVASRFGFTQYKSSASSFPPHKIESATINWLLPAFENSSGGHLTIFRLIKDMEDMGFKNRIVFERKPEGKSDDDIRRMIGANFLPIECPISFGLESALPAYFAFATNWTTAYMLRNFDATIEKCYIVQDYEPYFYPFGTEYFLAESTYRFGFKTFVGGDWIASQLNSKHSLDPVIFSFGCDHGLYNIGLNSNRSTNKKTLLFYARPSTPRRGFELAMLAFEKLLERTSGIQIILAGSDLSGYELPADIKSVGIVPMHDLPKLYRDCDAALVLSFTNVSLLPLDLMASGCAVISNNGPQVEWLLNESIATLSEPDPESLSIALEKILTDDSLRLEKVHKAADFVTTRHWQEAADIIANSLRSHSLQHQFEQSKV